MAPPSETETSIAPVDISSKFNAATLKPGFNVNLDELRTGPAQHKKRAFELKSRGDLRAIVVGTEGTGTTGLSRSVTGIPVGEACTSLIFLHASARPALNRMSYRLIWDRQDTADLLGWYEVVYEDGFVSTIPIRYGVHILEWNWNERTSANDYCYGADPISVGKTIQESATFFAYEWINPRLGKVIREIALKGTKGFQGGSEDFDNSMGPAIASNAVILAALSMVKKRT